MRATEILLVDDNPADTDLTGELLARSGWPNHIHTVTDGAEAIAFLRQKGKYAKALLPDFVVRDLDIPKVNGHTVLTDVKTDPILRDSDCDLQHVRGTARHCAKLRTGSELLRERTWQSAGLHLRREIDRRMLVWFGAFAARG